MTIRIPKNELPDFLTEVLYNIAIHKICPLIATVEQDEESGIRTFVLTFSAVR